MHPATLIFILTYILISLGENSPRKLDRPTAALFGGVLMVMIGGLTRAQAVAALDLSTLAILFGLMVILTVFKQSGLPIYLANKALHRTRNPYALLALVVFTSGIASAIMLNDTVCLLGTPLLLELTAQAAIPPVPFLLARATGANIGSAMTLTGNPQNIIIGHMSGWGWSAFALRMIPIGLVCLAVDWLLLSLLYRKTLAHVTIVPQQVHTHLVVHRQTAVKSVCALSALIISFLAGFSMDFAAVAAAIFLLVWLNRPPREALGGVDWSLLLFFAGLFVVVEGFVSENRQVLDQWIRSYGTDIGFANVVHISVASVIGSNLFSNVPFVLIVGHWIKQMSNPQFIWMLLALTSTFAGNLTLFGSVANVIVAQGAQKHSPLGFMDFLKAGIPVTLVTTAVGVLFLWWFQILGLL